MKVNYSKPILQSEKIEVGIFGKYGKGSINNPLALIKPKFVFGACCRGSKNKDKPIKGN